MKNRTPLIAALMLASSAQAQVAHTDQVEAAGFKQADASQAVIQAQQLVGKLQQQVLQLQSEVREMQRQNAQLKKIVDDSNAKSAGVSDRVQELQNVQLVNVFAAQKQIAEQQKDILSKLWGEQRRDCPDLAAKHQQIKVLQRPDGQRTVRFLCYDGKTVHLSTEVHDPAE